MADGKIYKVGINYNNQIEVSYTSADGRRRSAASFKQYYETTKTTADGKKVAVRKLETRSQVVRRLCDTLGIKY